MPHAQLRRASIFFTDTGSGPPVVLVHGSWGDHHNWDLVVPELASSFRVITYDRRGHSQSSGSGTCDDDVEDVAALLAHLGLDRAHIIGNSFGAVVTLKLAVLHPELVSSIMIHEPPLVGLLAADAAAAPMLANLRARFERVLAILATGDHRNGARMFVEEVALGAGEWDRLPAAIRETFVTNAPTWADEMHDRDALTIDLERVRALRTPALLTDGTASPPLFAAILAMITAVLPGAQRERFEGAGHVPHMTHKDAYVRVATTHLQAATR